MSALSQFQRYLAQTSAHPISLEVVRAEDIYLFDRHGRTYIDLISGISVSNLGHHHPRIITALRHQLDYYLHTMVYGEYIQAPQVDLAEYLISLLPSELEQVFLVNSGSEAIEGAMKLAKRYTGRYKFMAFRKAYHGSSHGALSLMDSAYYTSAFRPLLPQINFLDFNHTESLSVIDETYAAVVIEPVQGEAGVIPADHQFLQALRQRCTDTGTLLIYDEIQTGLGRTGTLYYFEKTGTVPDILVTAKALGAGLPLGAFISSAKIMRTLAEQPVLGHITTFGGHPLSCAAALAGLRYLYESNVMAQVPDKSQWFRHLLDHRLIKEIRHAGLLMAVDLQDASLVEKVVQSCKEKGVLIDWFLHNRQSLRIAPPLIINQAQIEQTCQVILSTMDKLASH